jgi:hypothetical protein
MPQDDEIDEYWKLCSNCPNFYLNRRIGNRYGFALAQVSPDRSVLLGGIAHSESPHRLGGAPLPFSQIYLVQAADGQFDCDLVGINESQSLPDPRAYHTAVSLPAGGLAVFGGQSTRDETLLSDLWLLELSRQDPVESDHPSHSGIWRELTPSPGFLPGPRSQHASAAVSGSGILVFGGAGSDGSLFADVWIGEVSSGCVAWSKLEPVGLDCPPPRRRPGLSSRLSDCELILSGGIGANGESLSDFWLLRLVDSTHCLWTPLPPAPATRHSHLVLPDIAASGGILLYGGSVPGTVDRYDAESRQWSSSPVAGTAGGGTELTVPMEVVVGIQGKTVTVPIALAVTDTVEPGDKSSVSVLSLLGLPTSRLRTGAPPPSPGQRDREMNERKRQYARISSGLPCVPPSSLAAPPAPVPATSDYPPNPLHTLSVLIRELFDPSTRCSVHSWRDTESSVLLSSPSIRPDLTRDALLAFFHRRSTVELLLDSCDSFLFSIRAGGDRFLGFCSERFLADSRSGFSFPIVSVSDFVGLNSVVKIIVNYSQFSIKFIKTILHTNFILLAGIDCSAESTQLALTDKSSAVKDPATLFLAPGNSVERLLINSSNLVVNGKTVPTDFRAWMKKSLVKPVEAEVEGVGTVLIGSLKGKTAGLFLYSDGVFVRRVETQTHSGLVEVGGRLTPVDSAGFGDFVEALEGTPEWTDFNRRLSGFLKSVK